MFTKPWTFGMSIVSNRNESSLKSQFDMPSTAAIDSINGIGIQIFNSKLLSGADLIVKYHGIQFDMVFGTI